MSKNRPPISRIIRRVSERLAQERQPGKEVEDRRLDIEALEQRILFSGTAAPAPEPASEPAQEAPPATEAPQTSNPTENVDVSGEPVATVSLPDGDGTNSESPLITLDQESMDAVAEASNPNAVTLQEVETLAQEAAQRWLQSGISTEQVNALTSIDYQIGDLGAGILGATQGAVISIDDNAAGTGWFVDLTPEDDDEFTAGTVLLGNNSDSLGRTDLLTVLIHEQGHILGLTDTRGSLEIMDGVIGTGERRLPDDGRAQGAVALSLEGTHYAIAPGVVSSPGDGLLGVQYLHTNGSAPGNNTDNWLAVWDALDSGDPVRIGTVGASSFDTNQQGTSSVFNYGGGGNFGSDPALSSINEVGNGTNYAVDNYSIRAEAGLRFTVAGTYTIAMGSDDGRRVELTEFQPGSAPGYSGITQTAGQINTGAWDPGNTVFGFSGGTGHNQSLGTFTVAAGDILKLDAFYYEGSGGDSGEISIVNRSETTYSTGAGNFELLADGVYGIEISSFDSGFNTAPVVADLDGDQFTYSTANVGNHVALDQSPAATLTDADSPASYDGGQLIVSIIVGNDPTEDTLGLGATVNLGDPVMVGGVTIGTIASNGQGANSLIIDLNSDATVARVQDLIRSVSYQNSAGANTLPRAINLSLSEGDGTTSNVSQIIVNMDFGGTVDTFIWDGTGDGTSFSDNANFVGDPGAGPDSNDIVIFRDDYGNGTGLIDLGGGTTTVGEFRFDGTGSFTILNSSILSVNRIDQQATASGDNTIDAQLLTTILDADISGGTLTVTNLLNSNTVTSGDWRVNSGSELVVHADSATSLGGADVTLDGGILTVLPGTQTVVNALDAYAFNVTGSNSDDNLDSIGQGGGLLTQSPISHILIDGDDRIDYRNDNDFRNGDAGLNAQGFATSLDGLPGLNQNDNFSTMFVGQINIPDLNGGLPYAVEFGTNRSDDPSQIYVDLDQDGTFEAPAGDAQGATPGVNERVVSRNCCGSQYNTVTIAPGTYDYMAVQLERGGGSQIEPTIDLNDGNGRRTVQPGQMGGLFTSIQIPDGDIDNNVTLLSDSTINLGTDLPAVYFGTLEVAAGANLQTTATSDGQGLGFDEVILNGDTTFDTAGGANVTLSDISETVATSITFDGDGIFQLDTNNSFTGDTILTDTTTVIATADGALGTTDGNTLVNAGTALVMGGMTTSEEIDLRSTGNSRYNAGLHKTAGGSIGLNGLITVNADARIRSDAGNDIFVDGGVSLASGTTLTFEADNRINIRNTGITGDATTTLRFEGNDRTDAEVAIPNFLGDIEIFNDGRLDVYADGALGDGAGVTRVLGGNASLILRNGRTQVENVEIGGDGRGTEGAIRNENNNNTIDGNITLVGDSRIQVNNNAASSLTVTGQITGNFSIDKQGPGTLILEQDNTFNNLALSDGSVRISSANGLGGTTSLSVDAGEALELDGNFNIDGGSNLSTFTFNGGTLSSVGGSQVFEADINVSVHSNINFGGDGGNLTITKAFGNGIDPVSPAALSHFGYHINNDSLALNLNNNEGMLGGIGGGPRILNLSQWTVVSTSNFDLAQDIDGNGGINGILEDDGLTVGFVTGDHIVLTGQTDPTENGVYQVQGGGTLIRDVEMDAPDGSETPGVQITATDYAQLQSDGFAGPDNSLFGSTWHIDPMLAPADGEIGTDPIIWTAGAAPVTATTDPTTFQNFEGHGLLTDGPGGRGLDFNNDGDFRAVPATVQDDASGDGFVIDQANNYSNLFWGTLTVDPADAGTWTFDFQADDDRVGFWIDLDQDGIFESDGSLNDNRGEQITWDDQNARTVNLAAGEYMVAFTHREGGGGSQIHMQFSNPSSQTSLANIQPSSQPGMWRPLSSVSTAGDGGTPTFSYVQFFPDNHLVKTGSSAVTLMGANTYNGTTTISGGTVIAANNDAFGLDAADGGVQEINAVGGAVGLSGGITLNEEITVAGTGAGGRGALVNVDGDNTITGDIDGTNLGPSLELLVSSESGTLTLDGSLLEVGDNRLVFDGPGNAIVNSDITGTNNTSGLAAGIRHYGFHINNDNLALNLDANGGMMGGGDPTSFQSFFGESVLINGPGGRGLDFDNDADFRDTGSIGQNDNYSNLFLTTLNVTADNAGDWTFDFQADDDRVGFWIDLNQNGVFESDGTLNDNRGEQITWDDQTARTVTLAAGQYLIAYTHREGGGGSQIDAEFSNPTSHPTQTQVNPGEGSQAGLWNIAVTPDQGLSKRGTGTVTLTGNNTYFGDTLVEDGLLVAESDTALGDAADGTQVLDGATLGLSGGVNVTEDLVLNGNGAGQGALVSLAGINTFSGATITAEEISLGEIGIGSATGAELTVGSDIDLRFSKLNVYANGEVNLDGAISGIGMTVDNTVNLFPAAGLPGGYNQLYHFGYHINNDALALNLDNNGGMIGGGDPTSFSNFEGVGLLTDGPGDRGLDFNNDGDFRAVPASLLDDASGDGFVIDQNDNYSNLFAGFLHVDAANAGTWTFDFEADDDRVGFWIDLDQNGVFNSDGTLNDNRGEQITWDDGTARSVNLAEGDYMVAFTHREGGGGSQIDMAFSNQNSHTSITQLDPSDPTQDGFWNTWIFDENISNNALMKMGGGTLNLNGVNTYNGDTTIIEGTLSVNGEIGNGLSPDDWTVIVVTDHGAFGDTILTGSGIVNARVVGEQNSVIQSDGNGGNLQLGDGSGDAFTTDGKVVVFSGDTLTINDADSAGLGQFNIIDGTLDSPNGVSITGTDNLSGTGTIGGPVFTYDPVSFVSENTNPVLVNTDGTLVAAVNFGASNETNNGVTFISHTTQTGSEGGLNYALSDSGGPFAISGDPGLFFESATFGGDINLDVTGLDPTKTYVVEILHGNAAIPPSYIDGLLLGEIGANDDETSPNPGQHGVVTEIHHGQTNVVGTAPLEWRNNTTFVYTGEFFDADGIFSFAENIDDNVFIAIDGVTVLNNNQWDVATTTGVLNVGMGPNNDGWHTIDIRLSHGGGGAGAVAGTGWTTTYGFGLNSSGSASTDGADYTAPTATLAPPINIVTLSGWTVVSDTNFDLSQDIDANGGINGIFEDDGLVVGFISNDHIVLTNQNDPTENGVYVVQSNGTLQRDPILDDPAGTETPGLQFTATDYATLTGDGFTGPDDPLFGSTWHIDPALSPSDGEIGTDPIIFAPGPAVSVGQQIFRVLAGASEDGNSPFDVSLITANGSAAIDDFTYGEFANDLDGTEARKSLVFEVSGENSFTYSLLQDGLLGGSISGFQIREISSIETPVITPGPDNTIDMTGVGTTGILGTGDLNLTQGTTFGVDLIQNSAPSAPLVAGTDYDQLDVGGLVSLGGATLGINRDNGFIPLGDDIVIIDNDGSDAVLGTFDGLLEGATFQVDGIDFTITYTGGDGNDVVLNVIQPTEIYVDDDWAGSVIGQGVAEDPIGGLIFGYNAFALIDDVVTNDPTIGALRRAGVGATVHVFGGNYAEDVNIDKTLLSIDIQQNVADGDPEDTVNIGGNVDLDESLFVRLADLPGTASGTLPAANLTISGNVIGSDGNENLTIVNPNIPTSSANAGVNISGDITNIGDLSVTTTLTIDIDNSTIQANGSVFLSSDASVTGSTANTGGSGVLIQNTSSISTTGGNITILGIGRDDNATDDSDRSGVLIGNSTVQTVSGNIIITGTGAADEEGDGVIGVEIQASSLITSSTGNITIDGTGGSISGSDADNDNNDGVVIGGAIENTVAGNIVIRGTGGGQADNNSGVRISDPNAQVSIFNGSITISGTGGGSLSAGSNDNDGVIITGGTVLASPGGSGTSITILGTSSNSEDSDGVVITGPASAVNSSSGSITVTGTSGGDGDGVGVRNDASVASIGAQGGSITISGTGGADDDDAGVEIESGTVTTIDGNISIIGTGTGGDGVSVRASSVIHSTGAGTQAGSISLLGTGGGDALDDGVVIEGAGTMVTSIDGDITISGTGAGGDGVSLRDDAVVESTGTGPGAAAVHISGTGGADDDDAGVEIDSGGGVFSVDGNITVEGTSDGGDGVAIRDDGFIDSTGTGTDAGTITILGTGVDTDDVDDGVVISGLGARVVSVDGNITISGTGAGGDGVSLRDDAVVESTGTGPGAAAVHISGTGGADDDDAGVEIDNGGGIFTVDGNITVEGTSDGGDGVAIRDDGFVESTGTGTNAGTVTILGTGIGTEDVDDGVVISGLGARVISIDGNITISGTGAGGDGVSLRDDAVIESTGTGLLAANVTIDGTGGDDDGDAGVEIGTGGGILSVDGDISIDGTSNAEGVNLNGALIDAIGTSNVTITGTGGLDQIQLGVSVAGATQINSNQGSINLLGTDEVEISDGQIFSNTAINISGGNHVTILEPSTIDSPTINITVDQIGIADPGVGGTVTLEGPTLLQNATVTGGADSDLFLLTPSQTSIITVNGGNPQGVPFAPGDILEVTPPGAGFATKEPGNQEPDVADGSWVFSDNTLQDVIFVDIEGPGLVVANDNYQTLENSTLTVSAAQGILANDVDPTLADGPLTIISVDTSGLPAGSNLTVNADGSFTFIPPAGFSGIATFTYVLEDVRGQRDEGTVTILVIDVPDPVIPPTGGDDTGGDDTIPVGDPVVDEVQDIFDRIVDAGGFNGFFTPEDTFIFFSDLAGSVFDLGSAPNADIDEIFDTSGQIIYANLQRVLFLDPRPQLEGGLGGFIAYVDTYGQIFGNLYPLASNPTVMTIASFKELLNFDLSPNALPYQDSIFGF